MKRNPRLVRLFNEQRGKCCYCTSPMTLRLNRPTTATIEHITPRSHGGDNDMDNLACACQACNWRRGNTPLAVFLLQVARNRQGRKRLTPV